MTFRPDDRFEAAPVLQSWTLTCREEGLQPSEVQLVLGRYQAYCSYYRSRRSEPLSIDAWFEWYRMETASESSGQTPSPSGCSVDSDAHSNGAIAKPKTFLRVLKLAAAESRL